MNEKLSDELLARWIDKCRELGDAGDGTRFQWWDDLTKVLTELQTRRASSLAAPSPSVEPQVTSFDDKLLGDGDSVHVVADVEPQAAKGVVGKPTPEQMAATASLSREWLVERYYFKCALIERNAAEIEKLEGLLDAAEATIAKLQKQVAQALRHRSTGVTEERVERLARFITEDCFGYDWGGLSKEGRVTEKGYKPFNYNSFGGKVIEGTQNDLRDVARKALTAALSAQERE